MALDVSLLSPDRIIFKGEAKSIIVPGEQGSFEILAFHKRIISRLFTGILDIDGERFSVKRGIIKVDKNKVTIIIEEKA